MKRFLPVLLTFSMLTSLQAYALPKLSSYREAKATIYLDFDGQTVRGTAWNSGATFFCAPAKLTDGQINEIFNRVAEDYRPFEINITTDSAVFLSAPLTQRIRIIITTTSDWYPNVGGVSFTGSFTWGDDTPGFVFADKLGNSPKMIAECCTHESGHTVGLSHQAKYNSDCLLIATYNEGSGAGETSWAPVMGNSYQKNLSGWNNGPTPLGCTTNQDNLSIITTRNGFSYRKDDHSDDPAVNPTFLPMQDGRFAGDGIITTNADKDAFKINLPKTGRLYIEASPFSVGPNNEGANLDIRLTLLDGQMQIVRDYDPVDRLNVTVDTVLPAGDYFLVIKGASNANASDYGSLGSYTISGNYSPVAAALPAQVVLSGKCDGNRHDMSWSVVTDQKIAQQILQISADGVVFDDLTSVPADDEKFNYSPSGTSNTFYRLKIVSVTGQILYSNVVMLKAPETNSAVSVSSAVYSDITVKSKQNYRYQIADMSGRIIKTGSGDAGTNNISIGNAPKGIYIMQIICNNQRTTQRIVRM